MAMSPTPTGAMGRASLSMPSAATAMAAARASLSVPGAMGAMMGAVAGRASLSVPGGNPALGVALAQMQSWHAQMAQQQQQQHAVPIQRMNVAAGAADGGAVAAFNARLAQQKSQLTMAIVEEKD